MPIVCEATKLNDLSADAASSKHISRGRPSSRTSSNALATLLFGLLAIAVNFPAHAQTWKVVQEKDAMTDKVKVSARAAYSLDKYPGMIGAELLCEGMIKLNLSYLTNSGAPSKELGFRRTGDAVDVLVRFDEAAPVPGVADSDGYTNFASIPVGFVEIAYRAVKKNPQRPLFFLREVSLDDPVIDQVWNETGQKPGHVAIKRIKRMLIQVPLMRGGEPIIELNMADKGLQDFARLCN